MLRQGRTTAWTAGQPIGSGRTSVDILGVRVDALSRDEALRHVEWALLDRRCHVLHLCNAHNVLLAAKDPGYRATMNAGDLNLPDGMGVVVAGRLLGASVPGRLPGADLLAAVCDWGIDRSLRHFFYGGTRGSLAAIVDALHTTYPGLKVAGSYAPPFRPLTDEEADEVCRLINGSGAQIVWVGIGTPGQDQWMEAFRHRLDASVVVGVGAVFDFLSGSRRRAPRWMQQAGLEWLHRLASEPRRLWRRYLLGTPQFVARVLASWARHRCSGTSRDCSR